MPAGEVSSSPRPGIAVLSLALAGVAWATLIVAGVLSVQPPVLVVAVYVIAACALGVGVVASRRNKQFVAWRIVADFGIVLGLVLVILGGVSLYMFVKGIGFV